MPLIHNLPSPPIVPPTPQALCILVITYGATVYGTVPNSNPYPSLTLTLTVTLR